MTTQKSPIQILRDALERIRTRGSDDHSPAKIAKDALKLAEGVEDALFPPPEIIDQLVACHCTLEHRARCAYCAGIGKNLAHRNELKIDTSPERVDAVKVDWSAS